MMRTLFIKLFTLLILVIISSCSARKLNRQKIESLVSAQSDIRMRKDHVARYGGKHITLMSDSVDELYTISIIPADSFSFSAQHGFRGKAERLEITGQIKRGNTLSDTSWFQAEQTTDQTFEKHQEIESNELVKTSVLEKKSLKLMWLLIGFAGIIALFWYFKRWV